MTDDNVEYTREDLAEQFEILQRHDPGRPLVEKYFKQRKLEDIDIKELNEIYFRVIGEIQRQTDEAAAKAFIAFQLAQKGISFDETTHGELLVNFQNYLKKHE